MGHTESPSLIPLGLAADVSQEGSSFRWGILTSGFLHVLVVVMALFLRFQSTSEEPFRAMDVALISLPEAQPAAPRKEKASPATPSLPQAQPMKPQPMKPQLTEVKPVEEMLPPLPTQTASERLSEFLGGAIGSIVIPERRMDSPATPPQIIESSPLKDQSPLIENLRLPSTVPQLSRPTRLNPTEPLTIPQTHPTPPRKFTEPIMAPSEPQEPVSSPQSAIKEPAVRPAPALPELSQVAPFKQTENEIRPNDVSTSKNLEESFKRTLPNLPNPTPTSKITRKSKSLPPQSKKSSVPDMSAPQLAKIQPSQPLEKSLPHMDTSLQHRDAPLQHVEQVSPVVEQEQAPPREKMSKMMEQLLGDVKVPTLKPQPATPFSQQPVPSSSPSTQPIQSEMDHRIAKLLIPSVAPVESMKKRLQLLEVESTSSSGESSSQSSAGTSRYQDLVQGILQDQWENKTPLVTDAPPVVLKFRISRSGEISQIRIDQSSGNGYYDSAARRAVNAVNPLPPFPSYISDSFLDVRFQFIKTDQKH